MTVSMDDRLAQVLNRMDKVLVELEELSPLLVASALHTICRGLIETREELHQGWSPVLEEKRNDE